MQVIRYKKREWIKYSTLRSLQAPILLVERFGLARSIQNPDVQADIARCRELTGVLYETGVEYPSGVTVEPCRLLANRHLMVFPLAVWMGGINLTAGRRIVPPVCLRERLSRSRLL
jgi:hypothetical protein